MGWSVTRFIIGMLFARNRLTRLRGWSVQGEASSNAWLDWQMGRKQVVSGIRARWSILFAWQQAPLEPGERRYFKEFISARADEIGAKWIDFFVLHKSIKPEYITRRLK